MKIFSFFGYFELPETFKGGMSNALRIMANYHESIREIKAFNRRYRGKNEKIDINKIWGGFIKGRKKGCKLSGNVGLFVLKDNKWEEMEWD